MIAVFTAADALTYAAARGLRLKQTGRELRGPCPIHGGKDANFTLSIKTGCWFCFSRCGRGGSLADLEMELSGTAFPEAARAVEALLGRPAWAPTAPAHPPPPAPTRLFEPERDRHDDPEATERAALAAAIWNEAVALPGTIGECYLHSRGLRADNLGRAVRFHPRCPFAGERLAALVALLRDAVTDRPFGVHRTALSPDGAKLDRRMLGRARGAVVKLVDDAEVVEGLGLAEGLETALSVLESGWRPVWAALSAGGVANFPVLLGVESLTIFADHDDVGLQAAEACATRWQAAGREAIVAHPPQRGKDFNDRLKIEPNK